MATRGAIFNPGGAWAVTSERDATSHYVRVRSATSVDVLEQGASGQRSARRLFMQLHVFTSCTDVKPVVRALEASRIEAVLHHDLNDPRAIGVLAMEEDPGFVVNDLRALLNAEPFAELPHRTEFTMFGRTYASGFEPDLEDWLLRHPRRLVLDPARPWAVWYPLRRRGAFARLSTEEQRAMVQEDAALGRAYKEADLAHDIRLACHGLDVGDNDFVIGLVGRELHPLSQLVQAMRRTAQTAQYLDRLGPFFVGRVAWQSATRDGGEG